MLTPVILLAVIAGIVWYWVSSTRAREATLHQCSRACQAARVQFLDQTVVLSRLGIARDVRGRLVLQRWYSFDFSTDGYNRFRGTAAVLGPHVEFVRLEHPDGPFIMTPEKLHIVQ